MAQPSKEVKARYRESHREELRAKGRAYAATHKEEFLVREKRYRQEGREWVEKRDFSRNLRRYGMSVEEFNRIMILQSGCCAICKCPPSESMHGRLHVDHDHVTGKNRGLLCHACNCGLGNFRENLLALDAAKIYLQQFNKIG